jgi:hypothetical protein
MRQKENQEGMNENSSLRAPTLCDLPVADEQANHTTGGAAGGRAQEFDIIVGTRAGAPGGHVK